MKPLSNIQYNALDNMAAKPLVYTVAGFGNYERFGLFFASGTILSLEARGHCSIAGKGMKRKASITAAGRRALRDRPTP